MKKSIFTFLFLVVTIFSFPKVNALTPDQIIGRLECPLIELAEAKTDGSLAKVECYEDYNTAKDVMNKTENDNLVIIENGVIIDAKYAVVDYEIAFPPEDTKYRYIDVYKDTTGYTKVGYIRGGTPDEAVMLDYDYNTKRVKIKLSGIVGWMDKKYRGYDWDSYYIIPLAWANSPHYYTVTETTLVHVYPGNAYGNRGKVSYTIDRKPSMLNVGTYYSYDGHYFYLDMKSLINDYRNGNYDNSVNKGVPYYNYYQYLSFRTKTKYTSENINQYISLRTNGEESKLTNTGEYFINAQNNYGVNAILMLSIGMNESARGTSNIAKNYNNLFGLNAIDAAPGTNASIYATVEDCINDYGYGWLSYGFLDPRDYRFYGANLGNKYQGLNNKYASDPYWAEKAASFYYDFDSMFSFQDYDSYQLAVLNNDYSNKVYPTKTVGGVVVSEHYQYKLKDSPVVILEELEGPEINGNKIWYKIQSDATLDSNLDCIGSSKDNPRVIYNWDTNMVYVHSSYFTKIDMTKTNIPNGGATPNNPNVPTEPETPPAKPISSIVSEANYKYENGKISGINPNTSIETIKSSLTNTGGIITITDANGNTKETGNIGTGDKINITSGTTETLSVLIYGDITGDGQINSADLLRMRQHLLGNPLSGAYEQAAYMGYNNINSANLLKIRQYLLGQTDIIQK